MRSEKMLTILVVALVACSTKVIEAAPMGTAFTYQAKLMDANEPADGPYDFQFKLYDTESDGNQLGIDVNIHNLDVIEGHFSVMLDFGNVFDGKSVWIEVGVRPGDFNDPCQYTLLSPRREVTPVPYSLQTRGIFVDDDGNARIDGNLEVTGSQDIVGLVTATGGVNAGDTIQISGNWIRIHSYNPLDMVFKTGGSQANSADEGDERMRLTEAGNVGIGATNPSERLHINGSVRIVDGSQAANRVLTSDATGVASWQAAIPRGVIVMWSGTVGNIPNDWALCDGGTYQAPDGTMVTTPDLTSSFIRSVPNATTNPGSTGGSTTHSHGSGSYSGAGHSHSYSGTTSYQNINTAGGTGDPQMNNVTEHSHTYGGNTDSVGEGAISGTSGESSSLPPFVELAFIMKL